MAKVEWITYVSKHDTFHADYDQIMVDDLWRWRGFVRKDSATTYAAYTWNGADKRWDCAFHGKAVDEAKTLLQALVLLEGET